MNERSPQTNTAWRHPMRRIRHVHFVGIGGAGMSGIAEVMLNLGYRISGSDLKDSPTTRRLQELGAVLFFDHAADNVRTADAVVVSSAIDEANPEVAAARERRVPIVPRAQMLAELMRFRPGIAVAGTHGKTTATSLVATLLDGGGMDPTYIIGGRVNNLAGHGCLGQGDYLVAEADESDASFLFLQPVIAIVTNIDADHLATYDGEFGRLEGAFREFIHHLPFYGLAVMCADDPTVRRMLPDISRPVLTYGIEQPADVVAESVVAETGRTRFTVSLPDGARSPATRFEVLLNLPGRHNVLNALAAIAVAHELGVDAGAIQHALAGFAGIGRRFQRYGALPVGGGEVELIDDYGHHPTEIRATIAAAREAWPGRRLVVAFQPHRYSRTHDLLDDFAAELSAVDVLCLCEVYPAGEAPIAGADGRAISQAVRARGRVDPVFVADIDKLPEALGDVLRPDDILLTLGAGSIGTVGAELPAFFGGGR